MQFNEVKAEVKGLNFDSIRADDDNYLEVVIPAKELGKLTAVLDRIFGGPAWPSSNSLSDEAKAVINNVGGIRKGQTLYCWHQEGDVIFAMLWPWQDGKSVTVKMGADKFDGKKEGPATGIAKTIKGFFGANRKTK